MIDRKVDAEKMEQAALDPAGPASHVHIMAGQSIR
jgi:hypothetical protein